MADRVNVVNERGDVVGNVAAEEVDRLPTGLRVATPEQSDYARGAAEYGGLINQAGAVGAGALQELVPFGLGTAAVAGLGGADYLRNVEKYNPTAYMLGQGAGIAGQAILTGGESLAAKALSAPMRAGIGVERALGGGVAGLAIGGAVEGALGGVGEGVKQVALADNPMTGEQAAAALLSGATEMGALGGALGGGFGLAGKALGGIGSQVGKRLPDAGDVAAKFGDGTVMRLVDVVDASRAKLGLGKRGEFKALATKGPDGISPYQLAQNLDTIRADSVDSVYRSLTAAVDGANVTRRNFTADLKREQLARVIKAGNEEEVMYGVRQHYGDLLGDIDEMLGGAEVDRLDKLAKGPRLSRKELATAFTDALKSQRDTTRYGMREELLELRARAAEELGSFETKFAGGAADFNIDAHTKLDKLKRDLDTLSEAARKTGLTTDQATAGRLRQGGNRLRAFLEDSKIWGEAGNVQRKLNAPWHDLIAAEKRLLPQLVDGQGVVDRAKVERFVNAYGTPNAAPLQEALQQYVEKAGAFNHASTDVLKLSPADAQTLKRAAKALQDVPETTGALDRGVRASELLEKVAGDSAHSASMGRFASAVGRSVGGGIGYAVGGIPGAIVGGSAGSESVKAVLRPGGTLHALGAMEGLLERFTKRVNKGTKSFVRGSSARSVAAATRGTSAIQKRYRAHKERRDQLERANAAPDMTRQALTEELGDLNVVAPQAAGAMVDQLMTASEFLYGKVPTIRMLLAHERQYSEYAIPEIELAKFERYDKAVSDPLSLPDLLAKGELHPDHMDAAEQVWPAVVMAMRSAMLTHIEEMAEKGQFLPFDKRNELGLLLKIPIEPTLSPDFILAMQDIYADESGEANEEGPQKGKTAPGEGRKRGPKRAKDKIKGLSGAFATEAERTESRGR